MASDQALRPILLIRAVTRFQLRTPMRLPVYSVYALLIKGPISSSESDERGPASFDQPASRSVEPAQGIRKCWIVCSLCTISRPDPSGDGVLAS